jgi:hypothetical protein
VPCPTCGEPISVPIEARNGDPAPDGALVVNLTVSEDAASAAVAEHLAGNHIPHLIQLRVSAELAEAVEQHMHLIPGRLVRRDTVFGQPRFAYWMDMPDAPAGAAQMTPVFSRADDGTIGLLCVDWHDADGNRIAEEAARA